MGENASVENGAIAILLDEDAVTPNPDSINDDDDYEGTSIAVENSIGINEIAYSELYDGITVGVSVTFYATFALSF